MRTAPQSFDATDPRWPRRLDDLGTQAPVRLWSLGSLPVGKTVAIVGSRQATGRGLEASARLAAAIGSGGAIVVSGGAIGIDAAAHRGALAAGAATVVVLGTGIDVVYPREHGPLFREIALRGGAILSDIDPGAAPRKGTFPRRNRLIAALADVVVVVEAGEASGSLHTAWWAARLRRPIVVLGGSPGCDRLASAGAILSDTIDALVDDVRAQLAAPTPAEMIVRRPRRSAPRRPAIETPVEEQQMPLALAPVGEDAARLQAILTDVPRDLSDLAHDAKLPTNAALAAAIDLELRGLARRVPGGRYLRSGPTVSMRNGTKRRSARTRHEHPNTHVTLGRGR